SVSEFSATLNALVDQNGDGSTTCVFQYGTDPLLTIPSVVDAGSIRTGTTPVQVSANISSLSIGTTYYFRILANNVGNSVTQSGQILSFTVVDLTAPQISGSFSPVMVYEGSLGDYRSQAITSDNVGGTEVLQVPAPGTVQTPGNLMVTLTAYDAAGNHASTAFNVVVRPAAAVSTALLTAGPDGDAVPAGGTIGGPPADGRLVKFGAPAIDGEGRLAFVAAWTSEAEGKGSGVFRYDQGYQCLAKTGGNVPRIERATVKTFADTVIDAGRIAFRATIAGVPKAQSTVVMADGPSASLTVIAQTGTAAPEGNGVVFKTFDSLGVSGQGVGFIGKRAGGTGDNRITATSDRGFWVMSPTLPLTLALHEGQIVQVKTIKTLIAFAVGNGSSGQGRGWLTGQEFAQAQ